MSPMVPAARPVRRLLAAIVIALASMVYVADSELVNASSAPSTPRVNKFLATAPTSIAVQPYANCWTGGTNCFGPDLGGGAPTSFTVTVVEDPSRYCTAATSLSWCTISGLSPDQPYTLQATASNAFGTSLPSTPTQAVTTPTDLYTVGAGPQGVAVTSDQSYAVVANYDGDSVSRINLADGIVVNVSVGNGPLQVALDDTYAYVTNSLENSITRINVSDMATTSTLTVCTGPTGIARSPVTATAYVACPSSNTIQRIDLATWTVLANIAIPGGTQYLAIDNAGETLFTWRAFGSGTATLSRLRLADDSITHTATVQRDAVGLGTDSSHVYTLNSTGLLTTFDATDLSTVASTDIGSEEFTSLSVDPTRPQVFALARNTHLFKAVDTTSLSVSRTYIIGDCTHPAQSSAAPDGSFIIVSSTCPTGKTWNYSLTAVPGSPPAVSSATPSSGSTSGGTLVTITGTNLTGTTNVTFGGTPATFSVNNSSRITATTPAGPVGDVDIAVSTNFGSSTLVNGFTYIGGTPVDSPPPPTFPPAAPTSVTAVAAERSAIVSWQAPDDAGSFVITHYQVTSTPGGRSCLSTTPTCVIDGLIADVPYTFTVRALNGAGWGTWSEPSEALTWPEDEQTSIIVTGGRTTGRYIEFTGSITGTMPDSLRPMITFHGQTTPAMGRVVVPAADGTFTWSRRLTRAATITFIAGEVTSSPIEVASTGRGQRR